MNKNIVETIMGAVVLVVALAFVVIAFSSQELTSVSGYEVRAEFDDVTGIGPGTEVRMAGVKVGTVLSTELDANTFFANVTMSIDEDVQLPADTSAKILSDGLLGGSLIALDPGGALENIEAGGRIEHTQGSINLVELLGRFVFSAAETATE